jgi:putative PIN family toxin of toxin-antitoxin system
MEKLQVVVDTNVLIAALRSERGAARLFVDRLDDPRWQINVSTALLLEYEDVLTRANMAEYISHSDVEPFIEAICSIARFREIFFLWRESDVDPDDAFILELAIHSGADFLVTFNTKHFAAAADFGVKLITPKEFLRTIGEIQ